MIIKPKLLIFIDWFYPAYKAGGPIKSVFNILPVLKDSHEIIIVTSAYDLDGTPVDQVHDKLIQQEGYEVIYLTKENQKSKTVKAIVDEFMPDLIYLNSVFSISFTLLPLFWFRAKFKTIIAPRGMLGAGALKIKSLKKRIFLFLGKRFLFYEKLIWHASTELEAKEIRAIIGKKTAVFIAQDLSSQVANRSQLNAIKESGGLNLVFLSRISEKKNLFFLIEMLSHHPGLNVTLDIYGPIEDTVYWKKCNALVAEDNRIKYVGVVQPNKITEVLHHYHFSVLPTVHENYGHSIAESITSLVPVLVSKNTPWLNLASCNIGYDLELDEKVWLNCMHKLILMNQVEYNKFMISCRAFAQKNILSNDIIQQNQKLFSLEY
jgi:glycosyltransferase involved in cell wall biosynthesis